MQRLARGVGDFVNQHYGAAWALGLVMTCLIMVLLSGAVSLFSGQPCVRDNPENWPYSTNWWPGETGEFWIRGETPEECMDRYRREHSRMP